MADLYMMTAEERRVRQLSRKRLLLSAIAIALLLAVGLVAARPVRRSIKAWQARRHAATAFRKIDKEQWPDARDEAIAAYQLSPNEPQALRAVARFLSRTRQPDALQFWDELGKIDKLTREDFRDEASIALFAGEISRAENAVQSLVNTPALPPTAADWMLEAQLSIQRGAPNETFAALDKIFADAKATRAQRLQAALLEQAVAGEDTARSRHGQSELEKLGQGKDEVALNSLVILAQSILNRGLTNDQVGPALEAHPLARTSHKLLALDLQIRAAADDAARRNAMLDLAMARFKDGDVDSLVALATWLNGKGEHEKTLQIAPLEKALQSRDLFLCYVDALGALGRWEEIRGLLESERFPLDPTIERMYLARCYAQLGQPTASANNWQRALEAAAGDAGKLVSLAGYAEKNGRIDPASPGSGATSIAPAAYDAAIALNPRLRVAWQGKLRLAQTTRDAKQIHDVVAGMLEIWPNDPAIANDEAYTRLLLIDTGKEKPETGKDLNAIVGLAERLVQQNQRSLPHRTLLALGLLKSDRAADALKVYENIQVADNALTPSALAVHAAVLAANGKLDDAKAEEERIKLEDLLTQERELVQQIKSRK